MGCKSCKSSEGNEPTKLADIINSIKSESSSSLTVYLRAYLRSPTISKSSFLNSSQVRLLNYQFSLLSYSLVTGSLKCFRLLHERFSCSIPEMIKNFSEQNLNPLNVLCEYNHSELLKHFLPLYFKYSVKDNSIFNDTLDFHNTHVVAEQALGLSPMQTACFYGSIACIDYLHQYFNEHPYPELDLNEKHDEKGENSAFFAVRSGSILAVKLLYENYGMNFNIVNKFNENLLQVCALCSSYKRNPAFFEVFEYLIETVGLDVTINYEEILILLRDKELVDYYEKTLKAKGILANKQELELRNQVKPCMVHLANQRLKNESIEIENPSLISSIFVTSQGTDFGIGDMFEHKQAGFK